MLFLSPVLLVATAVASHTEAPKDGEELVRQMHDRHAGKWYQTLTFVQKTTHPDGKVETWYEAVSIPGLLRIDIAPLDSGNAILFRHDSLYPVRGGQVRPGRPLIHPLMVLGFDVYGEPADRTIAKLKILQFNLAKLRTDTWQGRKVYVVGADAGDSGTSQFWVDQENLLFVRMIQPDPAGSLQETQFNKYVKLGGGWIAPEVLFFTDGKPATKEEYADMRVGMKFDPSLFDPGNWGRAGWIK